MFLLIVWNTLINENHYEVTLQSCMDNTITRCNKIQLLILLEILVILEAKVNVRFS